MSLSPFSFTTALDESFTFTVSLPVISCLTSTSLLFSRVGNPFLTPDYLLDGCIGLASDGEGGPTSGGGLGMPRIATVWGGHINGEGTIVAESLDASPFTFYFCELAIGPKLATSVAFGWL